ncbi:MAG: ketoacyl-ACP synthase III [Phycisphaeraceae bacterium]|nr:ketoacyl-ACP synthase III [Phycisphaeraceae bacterium]
MSAAAMGSTNQTGRTKIGIRMLGTGMSVPPRVMTNQDLAKLVDTSDDWISQRTGIRERRVAAPGVTVRHLAVEAARQAVQNAGIDPKQLDMLILATTRPEMVCPSTAARVVAEIGASPAGALDVNAVCSGFVYALNVGASMIQSGAMRTVAVLGADVMSAFLDWKDRGTCILFGDGAAGVILTASDDPEQGCLRQTMGSDGNQWQHLYCPRSAQDIPPNDTIFSGAFETMQMNGREIYRFAVATLQGEIDRALDAMGLKPSDLAMIISHQSNSRIMESARQRLGLPPEKLYINIDRYGNTSSASVPICLHELWQAGRLKAGDLVLFVALGGGLTWASSLWRI